MAMKRKTSEVSAKTTALIIDGAYARIHGRSLLQVEIYSTKPRSCKCTSCGHKFNQNVQKGVDNGWIGVDEGVSAARKNHIFLTCVTNQVFGPTDAGTHIMTDTSDATKREATTVSA
ncbi:hypothetical protein PInf_012886 [Phytophthora infestans]|nr:hypothetical protein PInf_012886 [Phytophthora infestans]